MLTGVRVVDFGQYIAAPAAAAVLADLGAEVVKIEPLIGDQARRIGTFGEAMVSAYNRGKKSLAVDLRDEQAKAAVRRLVARADVVVQNMRPGALERLGFGYSDVSDLNPGVIYASVTGFGIRGPSRDRPGLDIAGQAESGMMSVTGEVDGDPLRVGLPVVDAATADSLTQAILAALFRRERTGKGADIEVSLLDVGIRLQAANWTEYFSTGVEPTRRGNGQPTVAPAADVIATSDGHIVVSAYTAEHWAALCHLIERTDLLEDPRFLDNPSRVANREKLVSILSEKLSELSTEACVRWLSSNGIVVGAVRSYSQVLEAEDVKASGIFRSGCEADGSRYVGLPYSFAGRAESPSVPAPELGEHSIQVLRDAGVSATEIDQMLSSSAVWQTETANSASL